MQQGQVGHARSWMRGRKLRATSAGLGVTAILVGSPLVGGVALATPHVGAVALATPHLAHTPARRTIASRAALPAGTEAAGAVPAARTITGAVALLPQDPAGLTAFATAVSTPGSASYGHYLARGAFAARFGPTPASVHAVEAQLRASGLRITSVSSDNLMVGFTGTASTAGAAFGTDLEQYRLRSGRTAFATTSALTFPSDVAGSIQAVIGLDDLTQLHPETAGPGPAVRRGAVGHVKAIAPKTTTPAPTGAPVACPSATGTAKDYGGLTDSQIVHAYGVDPLYARGDTGAGETVDLFELEPYLRSDISAFDSCYFGTEGAKAMIARLKTVAVDGGEQAGTGEGEAELDIEDVAAVAPGAGIDVFEAPNTDLGALDNYAAMVNDDNAKVISTSWGDCEPVQKTAYPGSQELENVLFEQAAAQGQSIFAAAGDAGTADCSLGTTAVKPYLTVDDPASQPFVTSVGGLSIDDATDPPAEHVWNDGAAFGAGGGGVSTTWAQPDWQADSKVPGMDDAKVLAAATEENGSAFCQANPVYETDEVGCREVPDVSAQADEFTGAVTVYLGREWTTVGGTSSSTPLWAAMITLVSDSPACSPNGLGFVNPSLYAVASIPSEYKASFTDVTAGDNDTFGTNAGLYPTTVGYDMASGLGSPQLTSPTGGRGLDYYLCTAAATGRPTISGLTPRSIDSASGGKFTITGSGFASGAGGSLVAGVQIGTVEIPSSSFTVESATSIEVTVPSSAALSGNGPGGFFDDGNGSYYVTVTLTGGKTSAPDSGARLAVYASGKGGSRPEVDSVGPAGGSLSGPTPVTVYGSDFTGATTVSFGGLAVAVTAADVNAEGTQIKVTAPAADSLAIDSPAAGRTTPRLQGVTCAHPAQQGALCQVNVSVTTPRGTSAAGTILPEYSGVYRLNQYGFLGAPAGCGCEVAPSPTEFDYLPSPTISSTSTMQVGADGVDYASERGNTVVTLRGTGLDLLGLEWVDVGPSRRYLSENYAFTYVSADTLRFTMPAADRAGDVTTASVAVQTLASPNSGDLSSTTPPSTVVRVAYAPTVTVRSISTSSALAAGPVTGGTKITVHGAGFAAANHIDFADEGPEDFSMTRQYTIDVVSNTELTLTTPSDNPGTDAVRVCDATGCSLPGRSDTFIFFPPGQPRLTGSTPKSGADGDDTRVTLTGANLGYATAVYFGTKRATIVPQPSLLDSGSTTSVVVEAPDGAPGTTAYIHVVTVESTVTGSGRSPGSPAATFHFIGITAGPIAEASPPGPAPES